MLKIRTPIKFCNPQTQINVPWFYSSVNPLMWFMIKEMHPGKCYNVPNDMLPLLTVDISNKSLKFQHLTLYQMFSLIFSVMLL